MVLRFCVSDVSTIVKTKIREFEENTWKDFVIAHPSYKLAETCLDLVSPQMFWSISNQYPDLVTQLHVHIRLMGRFGFSAYVPWTIRADESLCFVCKEAKDDLYHFNNLKSCAPIGSLGPKLLAARCYLR